MSCDNHTRELFALKEIAEMLNTTNDMNQMLHDVLVKLLEVTGLTTGWIFFVNDTGKHFCAADHGLPPALMDNDKAALCAGDCYCLWGFRAGMLNSAVNVGVCKRLEDAAVHKLGDTAGISHHATVPLRTGDDLIGLLNVAKAGKNHFSDDELAMLESVAYQIGTAIKRTRLYQTQERNAVHFEKLGYFTQRINAVQEIGEFPLEVVAHAGQIFEWPHVSFFVHELHALSMRASWTEQEARKEWRSMPIDQAGPVGTAFTENRLVYTGCNPEESCGQLPGIGVPAYHAGIAIPLRIRSGPFGVLFIGSPHRNQFEGCLENFMYALADHISFAIENFRIEEQRREWARMEERNRLARDLHDSVLQKMFSIGLTAKGAEAVLKQEDPVVRESLAEIGRLSRESLKEMRALIWQLRPAGLENGLLPALKTYGESMGLIVYEQVEGVRELTIAVEETFWRIGQEAMNNVKKHAGTNRVHLALKISQSGAVMEIADQGRGFTAGDQKGRLTIGLMSMRERAEAMGGELSVLSAPGQGTRITVTVPLDTDRRKERSI